MELRRKGVLEGWPLVGWTALALTLLVGAIVLSQGTDRAAVQFILRSTARISFLLFISAFTASSLYQLRPRPWSRWMLRNRRYLGVSFATAHAFHGLALLAKTAIWRAPLDPVIAGVGGFTYLVIAAMAATSFDKTAAWLGARRWSLLHRVGAYYIWAIFFLDSIGLAFRSLMYLPWAAIAAAAITVRFAAWWKGRCATPRLAPGPYPGSKVA